MPPHRRPGLRGASRGPCLSPVGGRWGVAGPGGAPAIMHDAFEHVPILEKLPLQIDCLAAWGEPGRWGGARGAAAPQPEPLLSPIPAGRDASSAVLGACPAAGRGWLGAAVGPPPPGRAGRAGNAAAFRRFLARSVGLGACSDGGRGGAAGAEVRWRGAGGRLPPTVLPSRRQPC